MRRRDFLRGGLVGMGALLAHRLPVWSTMATGAQNDEDDSDLSVAGAIMNIHDPVIIKQDDSYYLFSTGIGIPVKRSTDLRQWRIARGGTVFQRMPAEAYEYVPQADSLWAPDISYYNGKYHLYYSMSTFGSNHSAIGLATNETLHFDDDNFRWVDHGIVIKSQSSDFWNAIDANLILDEDEQPWLAFGSHWGGIKMIRLDYETGMQSAEDDTLYSLAARAEHPRAIEAPFVILRDGYYYLFVSFDQCCNGIHSTYNVRVGRSESVTGPYEDRDGVPMMEDGGTQILFPQGRWRGPGHNAIFHEDGQDYMVYHSYDTVQGGIPTLRINRLEWDEEGWPFVPGMEAES